MTKPATCLVAMLSHVVQKVNWEPPDTKSQTFTLPSLPKVSDLGEHTIEQSLDGKCTKPEISTFFALPFLSVEEY